MSVIKSAAGVTAGFALLHVGCVSAGISAIGLVWCQWDKIVEFSSALGITPWAYLLSLCTAS